MLTYPLGKILTLTPLMVFAATLPAYAQRSAGRGIGRILGQAPVLIIPYLFLAGIIFAFTKNVETSLTSAFGLMIIGLIFVACVG
jgi:hypothetical protein